jgi:hypothetical protein
MPNEKEFLDIVIERVHAVLTLPEDTLLVQWISYCPRTSRDKAAASSAGSALCLLLRRLTL